jgi:hypothetical protein
MKNSKKKWIDSNHKAQRMLGKGGKVPTPANHLGGLIDDANRALGKLNKSREAVLEQVQNYENSLSEIENGLTSYEAKIGKSGFGLDQDNPEDKKRLDQARKTLLDAITGIIVDCTDARRRVIVFDDQLENEIE